MTTTSSAPGDTAARRGRTRWFILAGLLVALLLAGFGSYYASSAPDGLNKVAADKGLDAGAKDSATAGSPLADYSVTGVSNERLSSGLAGVIGVGVTLALAGGIFLLVRKREPAKD
jgi:cobalt/nickel transport protein